MLACLFLIVGQRLSQLNVAKRIHKPLILSFMRSQAGAIGNRLERRLSRKRIGLELTRFRGGQPEHHIAKNLLVVRREQPAIENCLQRCLTSSKAFLFFDGGSRHRSTIDFNRVLDRALFDQTSVHLSKKFGSFVLAATNVNQQHQPVRTPFYPLSRNHRNNSRQTDLARVKLVDVFNFYTQADILFRSPVVELIL